MRSHLLHPAGKLPGEVARHPQGGGQVRSGYSPSVLAWSLRPEARKMLAIQSGASVLRLGAAWKMLEVERC